MSHQEFRIPDKETVLMLMSVKRASRKGALRFRTGASPRRSKLKRVVVVDQRRSLVLNGLMGAGRVRGHFGNSFSYTDHCVILLYYYFVDTRS